MWRGHCEGERVILLQDLAKRRRRGVNAVKRRCTMTVTRLLLFFFPHRRTLYYYIYLTAESLDTYGHGQRSLFGENHVFIPKSRRRWSMVWFGAGDGGP